MNRKLFTLIVALSLLAGCSKAAPTLPKVSPTLASAPTQATKATFQKARFLDPNYGWSLSSRVLGATEDGGRTWQPLFTSQLDLYSFDFLTRETGWLVASGRLYATADGGRTWSELEMAAALGHLRKVGFVDAQHGWVSGDKGNGEDYALHATSDGGKSWQKVSLPCPGPWQFTRPESGWLACEDALFTSRDGGRSWERLPLPAETRTADLHFLDERQGWLLAPGTLWHTADGGKSWESTAVTGAAYPDTVQFFTPRHGRVTFGFKGGGSAIVETDDGGRTWTQIAPSPWPFHGPWTWVDPQTGYGGSTLADPGAVVKTTDAGRTWQPIASIPGERIEGIACATLREGWALTYRHEGIWTLFRTTDGGLTWSAVHDLSKQALPQQLKAVDQDTVAVQLNGVILLSRDAGKSFERVTDLPVAAAYDFHDAATAWKADVGRILTTQDGGKSWDAITMPDSGQALHIDLLSPTEAKVLAGYKCTGSACTSHALYTTADGGQTWTVGAPLQEYFRPQMQFVDGTHGWLVSFRGQYSPEPHVLLTSDGGETWVEIR